MYLPGKINQAAVIDLLVLLFAGVILVTYDYRKDMLPDGLLFSVQLCAGWFLCRLLYAYFPSFPFYTCIGILLFGLVEAVWGLGQLYDLSPSKHRLFKTTGTFLNPGPYGGFLALMFPLGYTRVKHNDVVVFHIPYPNKRDKIEMHMLKYYIKRCIGVPGDTLRIVDGIYSVNADTSKRLGNYEGELAMSRKPKKAFPQGVYNAFPGDTVLNWNIKDFGPLYIPRKGDRITLDRTNALLYKKIIEWEKGYFLPWESDMLRDNGYPLHDYTFSHNYYFMGGDKVENSQDSRYWGLLPDDLIVGKAWLVWKSVDPQSGTSRRKRILKKIE